MNMTKANFKPTDLDKVVTLGVLLEYTDEFLIPHFAEVIKEIVPPMIKEIVLPMIKEANGQLKHELKEYIDEKLNKQTDEIFSRLERRFDRDREFKEKLIQILRVNKIGSTHDWVVLEQLLNLAH